MQRLHAIKVIRDPDGNPVDVEYFFLDATNPEESFVAEEFTEPSKIGGTLRLIDLLIFELDESTVEP